MSGLIPAEIANGDASKWKQSSRAQQLARVPWQEIAERIDQETAKNKRASQARIVREFTKDIKRQEPAAKAEAAKKQSADWASRRTGRRGGSNAK